MQQVEDLQYLQMNEDTSTTNILIVWDFQFTQIHSVPCGNVCSAECKLQDGADWWRTWELNLNYIFAITLQWTLLVFDNIQRVDPDWLKAHEILRKAGIQFYETDLSSV